MKRLVTAQEIIDATIIGGDVDLDKYTYSIDNTEIMVIEPLLGTELFDKIKLENDNNTITGLYLTLLDDYIKPILKYQTASEYIEVCNYQLTNSGLLKNSPQEKEVVNLEEIEKLSGKYSSISQMYIERFNKWIAKNTLPEYKLTQDEVDADSDLNINDGWWL